MAEFIEFIMQNAIWVIIIGSGFVVGIGLSVFLSLPYRNRIMKQLKLVAQNPDRAGELITRRYHKAALLRQSHRIEAFVKKNGPAVLPLIGMDDIWIEQMGRLKNKKQLQRVLDFAPEKGLFKAFMLCLHKPRLFSILTKWLHESDDLLAMHRIGLASRGEDFDGKKALGFFQQRLPEIRELAGDPEWTSRYFAIKILIHDEDERSLRALWEGFSDPHPFIRKSIVKEFSVTDREQFFKNAFKLFIEDPVFEVRQAAALRIYRQFEDLYKQSIAGMDTAEMDTAELSHILELLRPASKDDENFALRFLEAENLEIRLAAALFLEKCNSLTRLCLGVDMGDRKSLERNLALLKKSAEVNVVSFLSALDTSENPGTLLICAEILQNFKSNAYITKLAKRVFALYNGTQEHEEVYLKTLECIAANSNDSSCQLMNKELTRWRNHQAGTLILKRIPTSAGHIFADTLIGFLSDPGFAAPDELLDTLAGFAVYLVMPPLLKILRSDRKSYPYAVRIRAFRLLGKLGLPYCLQLILEYLPILTTEQARGFAAVIVADFPKKLIKEKFEKLLTQADSKIRASLISILPATGYKDFLPAIRNALKDADPDVRIAGIWASVEYDDDPTFTTTLDMLRDPLKRVRLEAAKAMGSHGADASLKKLNDLLNDPDEIRDVKLAAIEGLGVSENKLAIEILLECAFKEETLQPDIVNAIVVMARTDNKQIIKLVEEFKNAEPAMRQVITNVFDRLGEVGEEAIVDLLKEDIRSLKPFIVEILEATGGVASIIRRLGHREPVVRRKAASSLSFIGSTSAFRGIVMAARDPDMKVRVQVIKALEVLETTEENEILTTLQNDPDNKVRKYTHWALERLKAKAL
jgi:HEAT repeat protein